SRSELVSGSVLGKPLLVVFSQTLNVPACKAHVVRITGTFGSHIAAHKKVAVPNLEPYLVHPEIFKCVSVGALINCRTKSHFFLKHDFEVIGKRTEMQRYIGLDALDLVVVQILFHITCAAYLSYVWNKSRNLIPVVVEPVVVRVNVVSDAARSHAAPVVGNPFCSAHIRKIGFG